MLNNKERAVMQAITTLCDGTNACLLFPHEIVTLLSEHKGVTLENIENTLASLQEKNYLDLTICDRHGQKAYVINLKALGISYERERKSRQRELLYKLILAFIGAVATFIFSLLLKALFL